MDWLHIFAISVTLVGGIDAALSVLFGVRYGILRFIGITGVFRLVLYGFVLIAAVWLLFQRDTYLPFLGKTVYPCSLLENRIPDHADKEVHVDGLQPGAKVIFWAAEPATEGLARIRSWQQAYLDYANAGVATVDGDGHAVFHIRKPSGYTVMGGMKQLSAHVHWRVCNGGTSGLGPVQTIPIDV